MKPADCPECDMVSFRNGLCSHCGYEEPREWRPTPKPQVELGRKKIDEIRQDLRRKKEEPDDIV